MDTFERRIPWACSMSMSRPFFRFLCSSAIGFIGIGLIPFPLGFSDCSLVQWGCVATASVPEAADLQNQVTQLANSGRRDEAIARLQEARQLYQDAGDWVGEAVVLQQMGELHTALGNYEEAIAVLQPRLRIAQAQNDLENQSYALGFLTQVHRLRGDFSGAIAVYLQALDVARARGLRELEGFLLSDIAELTEKQGQTEMAILLYKQSVNQRELVRQQLRRLPPGFQEPYTQSVAYTYRSLADLLLQQDRVLEAQHVMDLLKVQELDDYLHDVRGSDRTTEVLEFLETEQRLLNLYEHAVIQGVELQRLREIPLGDRTSAQQQRLADLVAMEQELVLSFDDFLDRSDVIDATNQLSRTARRQTIDLEQLNALQDNLQTLDNAVLLYPLILDDRLELVLVTPYSPPIRRMVPVDRTEVNEAIANFRQMLTNPRRSNWEAAEQLYDWLIRPLEADIVAAQAETIIFAPDGALRYIPLAALRNDDKWLIQQFRTTTVTAASLTDFDTPPRSSLNVLAAAFADRESNYTVDVGTRQFSFVGLPYAGLEVDLIAAEVPTTTQLINQDFSRATTIPQMDDHTVIHLATHAEFVSGEPEESFILFGNGDRITLRDIATWTLRNVELVVLSACQTALGGRDGQW
ncbi:MAG: CHAT domain-containing protein [Cyanobacteria bacterium P01_E01_bin.6]